MDWNKYSMYSTNKSIISLLHPAHIPVVDFQSVVANYQYDFKGTFLIKKAVKHLSHRTRRDTIESSCFFRECCSLLNVSFAEIKLFQKNALFWYKQDETLQIISYFPPLPIQKYTFVIFLSLYANVKAPDHCLLL